MQAASLFLRSYLYLANIPSIIFSATGFGDAKNR